MPANITATPTAVSATANFAVTAHAAAAGAFEGPSTDQQGLPESFAALVDRLAAEPAGAGGSDAQLLTADASQLLTADATQPSETADALAAVLPFLEAMGLTRPEDDGATGDETGAAVAPAADFIAAALAVPANPAANLPATGIDGTEGLPIPPGVSAGDSARAATQGPLASLAAAPAAMASEAQQAVIDFSTQLAKATAAGGEVMQPSNDGSAIQAVAAQPTLPAQAAGHSLAVPQAVGTPGWDHEIGKQVAWLAHQAGGKAELVLTPPQMGRIEVSLTVSGDQASATFISANPVVREALESALPRLREVLAEAGIQLGQAQVGAENMRQSAQQEKSGDNPHADRASGSGVAIQAAGHALPAAGLKIGRGLVDVFA